MKTKITYKHWNIDSDTFFKLANRIKVVITIIYPNFKDYIHLPIKERIPEMRQVQRLNFQKIKQRLKGYNYKISLNKYDLRSVECELEINKIIELSKLKVVESIHVTDIPDYKMKKEVIKRVTYFYSVKCRYAIELEGKTKGLMDFDERIILIKALNHDDAEQKILKHHNVPATPYLNSSGELVRWRFDEILDICESDIHDPNDLNNKEGIEVYSKFVTHKITKNYIWKGKK